MPSAFFQSVSWFRIITPLCLRNYFTRMQYYSSISMRKCDSQALLPQRFSPPSFSTHPQAPGTTLCTPLNDLALSSSPDGAVRPTNMAAHTLRLASFSSPSKMSLMSESLGGFQGMLADTRPVLRAPVTPVDTSHCKYLCLSPSKE